MKTRTLRVVSGLAALCLLALVGMLAIPRGAPQDTIVSEGRQPVPVSQTAPAASTQVQHSSDHRVLEALADAPLSGRAGGFALSLPSIADDLVFEGQGQLEELPKRRARLTGTVVSLSNPELRFSLELKLARRIEADQPVPKKLSPSELMPAEAYVAGGGAIDSDTWRHYRVGKGSLRGLGQLAGAKVLIRKTKRTLIQFGAGANNVNGREGGFMTFRYQVAKQPQQGEPLAKGKQTDGVMALDLDRPSFLCADRAFNEPPYKQAAASHAFYLPGIDTEFLWFSGGALTENADGTAHLSGVIARETVPSAQFQVDLWFTGLVAPGDATYAPTGSPKLELDSSAYESNGGPVDPGAWRYYEGLSGSLIGMGDYLGAEYALTRRGPALQVGLGANGKNTRYGLSSWFTADLVSAPTGSVQLPEHIDKGDMNLDLEEGCSECATGPTLDSNYFNGVQAVALWMPGIADDLAFVGTPRFTHHADGSASFHGLAVSQSDAGLRFAVDLLLTGRIGPGEPGFPPPASPKYDLDQSAYAVNGGPVDTDTWTYFTGLSGTMRGLDQAAGAEYALSLTGPATQVGIGAAGKSIEYGVGAWLEASLVSAPTTGAQLAGSSTGDIALTLGGDCATCPDTADQDPDQPGRGSFSALWAPGLGSEAFDLISGGVWTELPDGTAVVQGTVADLAFPENRWRLDLTLSDRMDPGAAGHPPASSPKLDLSSDSYADAGGPIDPAGWHYYTTMTGALFGEGENLGAVVAVDMVGPPFQVGLGASGRSLRYGASTWLELTPTQQPTTGKVLAGGTSTADLNLDLDRDCPECPDDALGDSYNNHSGGHAFWIPQVAKDLVWSSDASYREDEDGTARLTGFLVSSADSSMRFFADVTFAGRLAPGEVGHPPANSPKLELSSGAYVDAGGPIDPSTWHYYTSTSGTLTGLGAWSGALIQITRRGPAFQVGRGASGKNVNPGASGWLDVVTLEQPTAGDLLPGGTYYGDINIDLDDCPD